MIKRVKKLIKILVKSSLLIILTVWLLIIAWLMLSITNVFGEETQLYGLNNDNWGESKNAKSHPNDKIYYEKTQPLLNNDACVMKVIYYERGDGGLVKEEILECADGRVAFDGPTYWQLFSKFYYASVNTPEYCRKYNRPNHPFKSYGTVCLDKKGKWKAK